jgi:hypothetical protein
LAIQTRPANERVCDDNALSTLSRAQDAARLKIEDTHVTLPHDYAERVYAGWLGKCIGVRFGAPTESLTYKDIRPCLASSTAISRSIHASSPR